MAKWRDVKQKRVEEKSNSEVIQETRTVCASLPSRLKAFLTDSFLVTTPILYIVIYLIMGSGEEFAQDRTFGWSLIVGTHSLIILSFWYVKFQTPGLKAYSLRIVNNNNERISFFQAIIRYVATLFALLSIILLFVPFFNKDKKTFQDIASSTIIIDDK